MSFNFDLKAEVSPETIHQIYIDGSRAVGSIVETLLAATCGKWLAQKRYDLKCFKKDLEQKLKDKDESKISPPEPYIAVPLFHAIQYGASDENLRDLYINLLSRASYFDTKDSVHPCLIEIIKQLSPRDAVVLKKLYEIIESTNSGFIPLISLTQIISENYGRFFKNIPPINCDDFLNAKHLQTAIDNFVRLGLFTLGIPNVNTLNNNSYNIFEKVNVLDTIKSENLGYEFIEHRNKIELTNVGVLFFENCLKEF